MRRILVTLVLVVGIGFLIWYAFRPLPVRVDVGHVTAGPMRVTLDHEGRTRVKDLYVVRAPLSGNLRRVTLDPGDTLCAGETVLAVIDPLEPALLDARAVATAEARVAAARAALAQAQDLLEQARGQEELARAAAARAEGLIARDAISRSEFERAERDARLWRGEVQRAESGLEVARFELSLAEAALLRSRPNSRDGSAPSSEALVLEAPIAGRVLRILRRSAGPITIGDPLLEMGDLRGMKVVADYLSTDAVKIEPGLRAVIRDWGGSEALPGRVRLVEPSAFTKISALGVEEQRVNVILDLLAPPGHELPLGDGYRVEVSVVAWEADQVRMVPDSALFRHADGWAAFAIREDTAQLVPVRVGRRNGLEAELLDGLEEGAEVVLHPEAELEDGALVRRR